MGIQSFVFRTPFFSPSQVFIFFFSSFIIFFFWTVLKEQSDPKNGRQRGLGRSLALYLQRSEEEESSRMQSPLDVRVLLQILRAVGGKTTSRGEDEEDVTASPKQLRSKTKAWRSRRVLVGFGWNFN